VNEGRIFPWLPVGVADLQALVDAPIAKFEPLHGGFTNTLHKVTMTGGHVVVVKHYAGGKGAFRSEVNALMRLAGVLPVPEVIRSDEARKAVVYSWIEGSTLDDCRKDPAAFASLADPLGRLFAWVARTEPLDAKDRWDVPPLLATARALLATSRVRERMSNPLATALLATLDTHADRLHGTTQVLCHHDIGGRNILVQRAEGDRWRIQGMIDWESAGTGSELVDLGGLFRYATRYDEVFVAGFERAYREAGGTLPDGWYLSARLLDSLRMIDTFDSIREMPGVFQECRMLLTKLVGDLK